MSHPLPNQSFGKYQILERIAAGGTAEVFKARLEGIGGFQRTFAIKRIRPGLSQNKGYIETLVDEAKIAGLLSHANIVQILDLGQVNGLYYVAMEYVDGEDLGTVLTRCASKGITFPVPHAIYVCLEMLKGLEYAHNRSIMRGNREVPLKLVHRDLAPSNILLSFQGEVKVTDFGIARANAEVLAGIPSLARGRYDYMSPEQIESAPLDGRSDIFAVGVILYEMLCGAHPFRQGDNQRTMEAVRSGEYEPPTMTNPDVPYGLEVVLEQALCRNPTERFPDSTAFKGALNKFFHDSGFIFSQSTLAAFLKGLFPKVDLKMRHGIFHEDETRPMLASDLLASSTFQRPLPGEPLGEDELETNAESEEDPSTVEAGTLQLDEGPITKAMEIPPEEEPTRAMEIPVVKRAPTADTQMGPRSMFMEAASEENEWDDAQATEVWRVPSDAVREEATQAVEPVEKTLVGPSDLNPSAQRAGILDAPTQPWRPDERHPGAPRIEKRPSVGEREVPPPTAAPTTEAEMEVVIAENTSTHPHEALLPAYPTLTPLDDPPHPPVPNLHALMGRPPIAPMPETPEYTAPDSDNEVIAGRLPPETDVMPPDAPAPSVDPLGRVALQGPDTEPIPDSVVEAVALQMAQPEVWAPDSVPVSEEAPQPVLVREEQPAEAQQPTQAPPRKPEKRSSLVSILISALALVGTLGGGFILGVVAMTKANPEVEPVTLKSEPRVSVVLPEGAQLFVDERDVPLSESGPTEITLSPGVPTQFRVELDGEGSASQTYTLDYNELRVIVFESVKLSE